MMDAIRLHPGPELQLDRIPLPVPAADEALVRVRAAALTRGELEWPTDRLPAIPSYELSGEVVALGESAEGVAAGDAVWALTAFDRDGVAAEYAAVPAERLAPRPRTLSDLESSTVPLAGLSAWQGLFVHGGLEAGERVLIHGAAGGVGRFATQLAVHRGAHVIGTASGAQADDARALGAAQVVDDATARFEDEVEPVDLVFDTVGRDRLRRSPAVLKPGGRLVSVAEEHPGAVHYLVEADREQLAELARLADAGDLRPAVDSVFGLDEADAAFARNQEPGKRGKVVLRVA
jgi:NADPH:quinone reductase-like Zn-dependent oxidoreductase